MSESVSETLRFKAFPNNPELLDPLCRTSVGRILYLVCIVDVQIMFCKWIY